MEECYKSPSITKSNLNIPPFFSPVQSRILLMKSNVFFFLFFFLLNAKGERKIWETFIVTAAQDIYSVYVCQGYSCTNAAEKIKLGMCHKKERKKKQHTGTGSCRALGHVFFPHIISQSPVTGGRIYQQKMVIHVVCT